MKRKIILPAVGALLLLVAGTVCYFRVPVNPFRHVRADTVLSVTVTRTSLTEGVQTAQLTPEQQGLLLSALRNVRVPRNQNVDWLLYAGGYTYELTIFLTGDQEEYLIVEGDNFGHNERNYRVLPEFCDRIEEICRSAAYSAAG